MKEISLILELESWDQEKYYDRLGLDKEYETILGKEVEKLVVPDVEDIKADLLQAFAQLK